MLQAATYCHHDTVDDSLRLSRCQNNMAAVLLAEQFCKGSAGVLQELCMVLHQKILQFCKNRAELISISKMVLQGFYNYAN